MFPKMSLSPIIVIFHPMMFNDVLSAHRVRGRNTFVSYQSLVPRHKKDLVQGILTFSQEGVQCEDIEIGNTC